MILRPVSRIDGSSSLIPARALAFRQLGSCVSGAQGERFIEIVCGEFTSGTFFEEGAELGRRSREEANAGKAGEIRRLTQLISKKRKALDRYLTAFEEGSMPKAHCSERVKEIGNEIEALEARKATLESEDEPPSFSRHVSERLKDQS